jgi:hypothetical protein
MTGTVELIKFYILYLKHFSLWCAFNRIQGKSFLLMKCRSWGSSVDIATGYRLDDRGSGIWFLAGAGNFSSTPHPNMLWAPPRRPLSNGYRGPFSRG